MNRLNEFLNKLEEKGIDIALITPGANFRYLVGMYIETYERLGALVLKTKEREAFLVLPKLDEEKAKMTNITYFVYEDHENPLILLKKILGDSPRMRIGIEDKAQMKIYRIIKTIVKEFEETSVDEILNSMRISKDEEELNCINFAVNAIAKSIEEISDELKTGMTEFQIARLISDKLSEYGAEPKHILVQSGPNSAIPHWTYSKRKIEEGEAIVIDVSATYNDYYGDLTRTFFVGKPNEEYKKIYNIVKEAHDAAIKEIRIGIKGSELDTIARKIIEKAGFGRYFIHRTGHGLGLEVHEEPYINESYNKEIPIGSVFTIEPGIYIPYKFGVRIESNIAILKNEIKIFDKNLEY